MSRYHFDLFSLRNERTSSQEQSQKKKKKDLSPLHLYCAAHWAKNHEQAISLLQQQGSEEKCRDTELVLFLGQSSLVLPFLLQA